MTVEEARKTLGFDPPDAAPPPGKTPAGKASPPRATAGDLYAVAEKECFRTSAKLVQKIRELAREKQEAEKSSQRLWEEKEALASKLNKYLVRNLIPVVDNCKAALAGRPEAAAALHQASLPVDGAQPPVFESPSADDEMQTRYLVSVLRSVLSLLNSLELYRIELLGRTTEDVIIEGETIDNPFEIEEAQGKGKINELRVVEVIDDLWVLRKNGVLEVVRKGKVKC